MLNKRRDSCPSALFFSLRPASFLTTVLLLINSSFGSTAQKASEKSSLTSVSNTSQFGGADTCKTCHEDICTNWEKTPHWKTTLNKEGESSNPGCEGCHGPGKAHVDGGGDITKILKLSTLAYRVKPDAE